MIISEEEGRIYGFEYSTIKKVLDIYAEFPRLSFDDASQQMRVDTCISSFPFNKNVPAGFQLDMIRGRRVRVTVELIDDKEK